MLTNLSINNIVLIDKLDIELSGGFCVLTGETGAGKSILLDALGLALGKRYTSPLLRGGQKQGSVTATFEVEKSHGVFAFLEEQGIDFDNEIFLRRVIYADNKTKSFINDISVGTGLLRQVAEKLIEIHGQHDQRGLLDQKTHMFVVDEYAKHSDLLVKTKQGYQKYKSLQTELQQLQQDETEALANEEYLKFVKQEIEALDPKPGLEEQLTQKRKNLLNHDKLVETINDAIGILQDNNVENNLQNAQTLLSRNSDLNSNFNEIAQCFERCIIELNEAVSQLQNQAASIEDSDENLEQIEERLFALLEASRKYNTPTDELGDYCLKISDQLDLISNKDEKIKQLQDETLQAKEQYYKLAQELSKSRQKAATRLEAALADELGPLKMGNTKLKVNIENLPEDLWSAKGLDKVEFLVSTNPGAVFAPINKIASGGELSRFMLALKVVLSGVRSVPTMIFDEVDTGIGGAVADAVGKRLEVLAKHLQVFAITHQPQVAARGNFHAKVSKTQSANGTTTTVATLSDNNRKEELARMLAGEKITDEARAAAERLLQVA